MRVCTMHACTNAPSTRMHQKNYYLRAVKGGSKCTWMTAVLYKILLKSILNTSTSNLL